MGLIRIVLLPCAAVAGLMGYSVVHKMRNYTEVNARIESIEFTCRPFAAPVQFAISCPDGNSRGLIREATVYVRYVSPADGREHRSIFIPNGGKSAEALGLTRGTTLPVLAHNKNPQMITNAGVSFSLVSLATDFTDMMRSLFVTSA